MRIAVVNKGKPYESIYIQKDLWLFQKKGSTIPQYESSDLSIESTVP